MMMTLARIIVGAVLAVLLKQLARKETLTKD